LLLFAVFVVVAAGVDRRWGVLSGTVLFGGRWISSSGSAQAPQNKPCGPPFWDRSSTFPKPKKKKATTPTYRYLRHQFIVNASPEKEERSRGQSQG
jgi:hypothetical protein